MGGGQPAGGGNGSGALCLLLEFTVSMSLCPVLPYACDIWQPLNLDGLDEFPELHTG
jgi:hypothetical protein